MRASEQRAPVRGAELAFDRSGEGPDVIWGHGLSQTRAIEEDMGLIDWDRVRAQVLRYDARGHGRSSSTPDLTGYSWAELARDQLALADHCGIGTYVAAGASMGCGTALHAALLAPERVRALVLVIPPTAWEARSEQVGQWLASAQLIEDHGVEALIEARAALPLPDPFAADEGRRDQSAAATRSWAPDRLARVFRGAALADLPDRRQVASVSVPALILAWTGDPVHPLATAEALAALLPDNELSVASTAPEVARWTERVAAFVDRLA